MFVIYFQMYFLLYKNVLTCKKENICFFIFLIREKKHYSFCSKQVYS